MSEYIYLAVLWDRHEDNLYAAYRNLNGARRKCIEWVKRYGKQYDFSEVHITDKWEYALEVFGQDDAPNMHVEKIELK